MKIQFFKTQTFAKILSVSILLFSTIILLSCKKKSSVNEAKNDYTKPVLEVSFSKEIDYVPLSFLTSSIGSGSGESETFGEKKSILIYFEEDGCTTCQKTKPSVSKWVELAGCKIYGYKENKNDSTQEERSEFLKKLGSADGVELTAGRLVAFTDGVRRGSVSGTFDLESAQNVDIFARRYFSFPDKEEFLNFNYKKLSGLADLRKEVYSGKKFILYTERYSCPWCRLLSNPQGYDSLTEILKNCTVPLYTLTTEDSLKELYDEVTVEGKKYKSSLEYLKQSGTDSILWDADVIDKKKAEFIEMLVTLKFINPCPNDDSAFLKQIDSYAKKLNSGKNLFVEKDRSVPSFCFTDSAKNPTLNKQNSLDILKQVYSLQQEELPHKAMFSYYFCADNEILDKATYNSFLVQWINSCMTE